jgi:TolB protein
VIGFTLLVQSASGVGTVNRSVSDTIVFTCSAATADDTDICTVSGQGRGLRRLTRGAEKDILPSWSPDKRQIAFVRGIPSGKDDRGDTVFRFDLYAVAADGSGLRRLVRGGIDTNSGPPDWSPNGRKLVFGNRDGFDVWSVNADATGLRRLTHGPAKDSGPSWSPDGHRIAFSRDESRIYLMNANGTSQRVLVGGDRFVYRPTWSPDGRRMAFTDPTAFIIYVVYATGGRPKVLATDSISPLWSPTGQTILFHGGGPEGLYVKPSRGGGRRHLVARNGWNAAWSPDGRRIAFIRDSQLYTMRADGSAKRHIVATASLFSTVDW